MILLHYKSVHAQLQILTCVFQYTDCKCFKCLWALPCSCNLYGHFLFCFVMQDYFPTLVQQCLDGGCTILPVYCEQDSADRLSLVSVSYVSHYHSLLEFLNSLSQTI